MCKKFNKIFLAIIFACISFLFVNTGEYNVASASSGLEYREDTVIENTTISSAIFIDGNATITLTKVKITATSTDIITVSSGSTLILNDVDFTEAAGTNGINNQGNVIINEATFDNSITYSIYNNTDVGSVSINNASLYSVYLNQGYLTVNENTVLQNESKIKMYFSNEKCSLGSLAVKGINTLAGYYLDKFEYAGEWKYSDGANEYNAFLDYVGDDSAISESGKQNIANMGLTSGDIILTAMTVSFRYEGVNYYCASKYGTASKYLSTLQSNGVVVYIKNGHYNSEEGIPLDNYKLMVANCNIIEDDAVDYYTSPVNATVVTSIDGATSNSKVYTFQSGSSNAIYVDIPDNCTYKGVTSNTAKVNASSIYSNAKFVRILLSADMYYTITNATITVNFEENEITPEFNFTVDDTITINQPTGVKVGDENVNISFILPDDLELVSIKHNDSEVEYTSTEGTISFDITVAAINNIVVTTKDKPTAVSVELEINEFNYNGTNQYSIIKPYYFLDSKHYLDFVLKFNSTTVSEFKNAGNYVIHITSTPVDIALDAETIDITMNQKIVDVEYSTSSFVYDGTTKTVTAEAVDICAGDEVDVILANSTRTLAGSQTVTASLSNSNYAIVSGKDTTTLFIDKATISITSDMFTDKKYKYNDNTHRLVVENLPNIVGVSYTNNDHKFVGVYVVKATFTLNDTSNYYPLTTTYLEATLTIDPIEISVEGVKFESSSATYDGTPKTITASGIPNNVSHVYLPTNTYTNAGTHTITLTLSCNEQKYKIVGDKVYTATLTINKGEYDLSSIKFSGIEETYSGETYTIEIVGNLPTGLTVKEYSNNSSINVCDKMASVSFNSTDANYNTPEPLTARLFIKPKEITIDVVEKLRQYTGNPYTVEYTISGKIGNDVVGEKLLGLTNTNAGDYSITIDEIQNANYVASNLSKLSYTISKANIDMSGISINASDFMYNGQVFVPTLEVEGSLPEGIVSNELIYTEIKNVGEYTILASFGVDSNHNKPNDITKTISVTPKAVFVRFSNDTKLVYNGQVQGITVEIDGTYENDFDDYTITYSSIPVEAGVYTCTVKLNSNTNYYILGDDTRTFQILYKTISYSNKDVSVIVEGDGFASKDELKVESTTNDIQVENLLKSNSCNAEAYNKFKISLDNSSSKVKVSLKVSGIDTPNKDKIKLYKIDGDELIELDYNIVSNRLVFEAEDSDEIILVESAVDDANYLVPIIIAIILTTVAITTTICLVVFFNKKKKKSSK